MILKICFNSFIILWDEFFKKIIYYKVFLIGVAKFHIINKENKKTA